MVKAAFFCENPQNIERVYGGVRARIAAMSVLYPEVIASREMLYDRLDECYDLDVIFSTWGMLRLDPSDLKRLPALKCVFYAAGSVKGFAAPFLQNHVRVVSAWRANGLPVAEYTVAHILLACSGYFENQRTYRQVKEGRGVYVGPGSYGERVGILGAGTIGRRVIELLRPYDLECLLFDPFLSDADAGALGVRKAGLEDIFRECLVVSNHLPLLPGTQQMIGGNLFEVMREHSTFINTGRGGTVDEAALIRVFTERPCLTAVLDVTSKEPPGRGSPLFELPNIQLTSHIAGSKGNELCRMAETCVHNFERFLRHEPMEDEVFLPMLQNMA